MAFCGRPSSLLSVPPASGFGELDVPWLVGSMDTHNYRFVRSICLSFQTSFRLVVASFSEILIDLDSYRADLSK